MAENYIDWAFHDITFWPPCSSLSNYSLYEVSELSDFNGYLAEENPAFSSLPGAYISQNSNSTVNDDDINFTGSNNSFHESYSKKVMDSTRAEQSNRAPLWKIYVMPDALHVRTGESDEQKKLTREKIAFRTKSDIEMLDDGFKWRKYGKKMVKNSPNPRNYYRCAVEECSVKKRVDRDKEDSLYVITTYEGGTIIKDILSFDFRN